MKKFYLSLIGCLVLVLAFGSTNLYALDSEQNISNQQFEQNLLQDEEPVEFIDFSELDNVEVIAINEYEIFNDLQELSESALKTRGFSDKDIKSIKKKDYSDLVKERAKLPREELIAMGYSMEEINIIKSGNSIDDLIEIMAINNLTLGSKIEKFLYESNGFTYAAVYMNWLWGKQPLLISKDQFALSWDPTMTLMTYSENNKSRYTLYKKMALTGTVTMHTYGFTADHIATLNRGVSADFVTGHSSTISSQNYFYYRGAARTTMKYAGKRTSLTTLCGYAHYADVFSGLSVSIGVGPLSINYSPIPASYANSQQYTSAYFDWR